MILVKCIACAIYSPKAMIRMVRFCNLIIVLLSKPQHFLPNIKWEIMSESFITPNLEKGSIALS